MFHFDLGLYSLINSKNNYIMTALIPAHSFANEGIILGMAGVVVD